MSHVINLPSGVPQRFAVGAGQLYGVRAEGAEITITEELDGELKPVDGASPIAAGATVSVRFNSSVIEAEASGAPGKLFISKSRLE